MIASQRKKTEAAAVASEIEELADGDDATIWRDALLAALGGFMVILIIAIIHMRPAETEKRAELDTQGNMTMEIFWDSKIDADVDLWVQGPGDVPVGYSNKQGVLFTLLRDDLGYQADISGLNSEISVSRDLRAGEYVMNIHLYRNRDSRLPLEVKSKIRMVTANGLVKEIASRTDKFMRQGEEITVIRFRIGADGRLEGDSLNYVHKPLRSSGRSEK